MGVDVARGGTEYTRMVATSRVERMNRTQHAHFERFGRQRFVVAHHRGGCEVVNLVAANPEGVYDVVVNEMKRCRLTGIAEHRRIADIADVDAEEFVTLLQQAATKVGADESHTAQHDNSFLLHLIPFCRRSDAKSIP